MSQVYFCMFFIGNRLKKNICLFLNPIVELLLFCLYMAVIPIKYVYTNQNKIKEKVTFKFWLKSFHSVEYEGVIWVKQRRFKNVIIRIKVFMPNVQHILSGFIKGRIMKPIWTEFCFQIFRLNSFRIFIHNSELPRTHL